MPLVGSLALFPYCLGANPTILNFDQVREICSPGWAVANHSYAHKGRTWGDPPEILTREQIREDLFWSQTLFAHELGRAPTHFVYPNGYLGYDLLLACREGRRSSAVPGPSVRPRARRPAGGIAHTAIEKRASWHPYPQAAGRHHLSAGNRRLDHHPHDRYSRSSRSQPIGETDFPRAAATFDRLGYSPANRGRSHPPARISVARQTTQGGADDAIGLGATVRQPDSTSRVYLWNALIILLTRRFG